MSLELLRMCAAAAADPTIGVNAMIAGLSLDVVAGVPDARPDPVTVVTELDALWVATQQVPENGDGIPSPALAIYLAKPAALDEEVETIVRDGHYHVAFVHVERPGASGGTLAGHYVNRAVLRFLHRFMANDQVALRTRNGVQLLLCEELQQPPYFRSWGGAVEDDEQRQRQRLAKPGHEHTRNTGTAYEIAQGR